MPVSFESVLGGVEDEETESDVWEGEVEGDGRVWRPTPWIRRIRGERAKAPGARIYASAYSPLPLCLNREYAYVCKDSDSLSGRCENRRDVQPDTNRGPRGPVHRTILNGEILASHRYVSHFGNGLRGGSFVLALVGSAFDLAFRKLLLSPLVFRLPFGLTISSS